MHIPKVDHRRSAIHTRQIPPTQLSVVVPELPPQRLPQTQTRDPFGSPPIEDDLDDVQLPSMDEFLKEMGLAGVNFNLRHTQNKKGLDYDVKLIVRNNFDSNKNKVGTNYRISFGEYFLKNNCRFKTMMVGTGKDDNDNPIVYCLFDVTHPMLKNSLDNIALKLDQRTQAMADMSSSALVTKILDGFDIHIPSGENSTLTVKFTIVTYKTKASNFAFTFDLLDVDPPVKPKHR